MGTPLKDWDVQINYGIKTGYNDAFIISTEKREEILANCQSEDERKRTAELIRPILRGRDIKRYGYNWAGLYLIATFPSRHYDIEQYPAVKNYLLSFGIERLEQTGKEHNMNGKKIKARKKTNNKWFETQDSISYWDTISPQIKEGLLDMYWQLGNGLYKYQNLFNAIANGDISQIREESKVQYKTPAGKWNFDKGRYENRLNEYFHYKFGGIITKRRFQ